ncbi:hypothetical protein CEP17_13450 [Microbacterium sp. PM5]|nr:hypothetical protein CEP17_13450 [Microbacterium sp. PM5]
MAAAPVAPGDSRSVAGVVLLFLPDPVTEENVRALRAQTDHVYIVDNSPDDPSSARVRAALHEDPRVSWLPQHANRGVAAGFNAGMRAAIAAGYDEVVVFDQDSTITPGFIETLTRARSRVPEAGVIGPSLRSAATGIIYRPERGVGVEEKDVLISSGSSFSRALLERIGLHDEPLFIDYVDHDICLRARRAGYRNLKVYDAVLDHRFGDSAPTTLFGRRVYLANYSLTRIFHATRNRVIVTRRYGFGRWFWEDLWFTTKAWVKLLLLEEHRMAKIREAGRGVIAGLRYPARERRW